MDEVTRYSGEYMEEVIGVTLLDVDWCRIPDRWEDWQHHARQRGWCWHGPDQSARARGRSAAAGNETTLGLPQAVGTRIACDMKCMVDTKSLLTTAATRPEQSSTGAPEEP